MFNRNNSQGKRFKGQTRTLPSGETIQGRGVDEPSLYIPSEVQSEINALGVDGPVEPPSGRDVGGIGSISRRTPRSNDDVTILVPGETNKIPLPRQYDQNPVATHFRLRNEAQKQAELDETIAKERRYGRESSSIRIPQGRYWYSTSGDSRVLRELTKAAGVFRDLEAGLPAPKLFLGDGRTFWKGPKGRNSRTPGRYIETVDVNSPDFRQTFFDQDGQLNQDRVDLFIDAVNDLESETRKRKWRPTFGDPSDLSAPKGATELAQAAVFELPIVDQNGKTVLTFDPQTGQWVPKTKRFSAADVLGVKPIPDQTASFLSQEPITLGGMIKDLVNEYTTEVRPAALINPIKRTPTGEERAIYGRPDGGTGSFVGMIDRKGVSLPVFEVKDNKDVYRIGNPTKYSPEMDYPLAELFGIEYKGWGLPELTSTHVKWARTDKLRNLVKQDNKNFKLYTASPGEKGVTYTELKPDEVAAEFDRLKVLASQRLAELRSSSSELAQKNVLHPGEFSDAPVLYVKDKGGYLGRKETSIIPMSAALGSAGLVFAKMTRQFEVPALVHPYRSDIRKAAEDALGVRRTDLVDEMLATRFSDPDGVSKAPYSSAREQLAFDVREFMNREGRPPTVAEQVNIARSLAMRRSGGPPVPAGPSQSRDPSIRYSARSTSRRELQNAYGALLDSLLVNPEVGVLRPLRPTFARNPKDLIQAEAEYPEQLAAYNAALQAAKEENYRALRVALGFPAAPERQDTRVSEAAAQAAVRALDAEVGTAEHDALMRAIGASLESRRRARVADDLAGLAPVAALPMESFRGNQAAYLQNLRASYGQDPEVRALTSRRTPREYIEQAALDVPLGAEVGPRLQTARIAAADRLLRRYAQQRRDAEYIEQQDAQVARYGQPVTAIAESMALSGMERLGRAITRDEALTLRDHLVDEYAGTLAQQGAPQEALSQLQQDVTEGILEAYARFNPTKPRMEQLNQEALRQQAGASWQPPRDDDDATTPEAFESSTAAPLSRTEQYDLESSERDVVDAELDRVQDDLAQDVLYTDPAALQSANEERRLQRVLNKYIRAYFESVGIPGGRVPAKIRLPTSAAGGDRRSYPEETLLGLVKQAMKDLDPVTYGMLESVPVNLRGLMRD